MQYTDNPVADFYAYDAECAAFEEKLPKCAFCGEPIGDEKCYYILDYIICPDCVEDCKRDTENFMKE